MCSLTCFLNLALQSSIRSRARLAKMRRGLKHMAHSNILKVQASARVEGGAIPRREAVAHIAHGLPFRLLGWLPSMAWQPQANGFARACPLLCVVPAGRLNMQSCALNNVLQRQPHAAGDRENLLSMRPPFLEFTGWDRMVSQIGLTCNHARSKPRRATLSHFHSRTCIRVFRTCHTARF